MAGSRIDLEAELDRLFALRPADFVPARNELAAHLRASGDLAAAGRVKALKRPGVPAWAVNQLRFQAPRLLAALLASADRLRSRSADLPGAMQARREAVAAARRKTAELLVAAGHSATPQTMQRVSSTLDALATYGNVPDRGVAGRLTDDLPAPGFDDLASFGILRDAAGPMSGLDRQKQPSAPAPASARAAAPQRAGVSESRANRIKEIAEAKKKEAERARATLLEAEGRTQTLRRNRQELEKALAEAERHERAHAPALAAASRAVRSAERAARTAATAEARLGRRRARSPS